MASRLNEAKMGRDGNIFFATGHAWGVYAVVTKLHAGTIEFNVVCYIGVAVCVLWLAALYRTRILMSAWNKKLSEMELQHAGFAVFSSPEFKKIEDARVTHSWIFGALIFIIGFCWGALPTYAMNYGLWIRL